MYYTIYKISNQIDGKFYIGSHKTTDLDDDYMGSGKYLKRAQEKYGIGNFTKEILFVFDTPDEMYAKEAEIVNEEFLATQNTYNLKVGGFGGFDFINSLPSEKRGGFHKLTKEEASNCGKIGGKRTFEMRIGAHAMESKRKQKQVLKEKYPEGTFKGKTHTKEHKEYMSSIMSEKQSAEKNSQYGTIWIYSLSEKKNKKIKSTDQIPEGWSLGRKMKF